VPEQNITTFFYFLFQLKKLRDGRLDRNCHPRSEFTGWGVHCMKASIRVKRMDQVWSGLTFWLPVWSITHATCDGFLCGAIVKWNLLQYSQYFIHISNNSDNTASSLGSNCSLKIFSKWNHFVGVLSAFNACVDVVHGVREVVSWPSCLLVSLASLSLQCDRNSASTMPVQVLTAPSKWPVRTKKHRTEIKNLK